MVELEMKELGGIRHLP